MIIIEDTREQLSLKFPKAQKVVRQKLDYGDYAADINGKRCPIVFERKSLGDLFGTLTSGHKRFKKEINRCKDDGSQLVIIIEKPYMDIRKGYKYSKMKGKSITQMLHTLMQKYEVMFMPTNSRREMAMHIYDFFITWEKNFK